MPPAEPTVREPAAVRQPTTPAALVTGVDKSRQRQPRISVAEDYDADTDVSELTSPTIRPTVSTYILPGGAAPGILSSSSSIPPRLLQDIGRKDSGHSVMSCSSKNSEQLSQASSVETPSSVTSADLTQTDQTDITQTDTSASARSDTSSQAHQSESLSSSDAASNTASNAASAAASNTQRDMRHSVSVESSQADSTDSKPAAGVVMSCTNDVPSQAVHDSSSAVNTDNSRQDRTQVETSEQESAEKLETKVEVPKHLSSVTAQLYNSGIEDISPASSPMAPSLPIETEANTLPSQSDPQSKSDDVKVVEIDKPTIASEPVKPADSEPVKSAAPPSRKQLSLEAYRLKKKAQIESQPAASAPTPKVRIPSPQLSVSDLDLSPTKSATVIEDQGLTSPVSSHTSASISSTKHGIAESLRKTSEWLRASKAAFEQERRQETEREMREAEVSSQSSLSTSVSEKQPEPASRVSLASYKARLQKEVGQVKSSADKPTAAAHTHHIQRQVVSETAELQLPPVKCAAVSADTVSASQSAPPDDRPVTLPTGSSSVTAGTADDIDTDATSRTIADLSRVTSLVDSVLAQGSGGKKSAASRELLLKKVGYS